jgi:transposase-like protein
MRTRRGGIRATVRYSEAFKLAIVRELEAGEIGLNRVRQKYGIRGATTVQKWLVRYGNGRVKGKVIRVERPEERDERVALKARLRALEQALADATVDLAIEREYVKMACKRAGITDVEEFKKKVDAMRPTAR